MCSKCCFLVSLVIKIRALYLWFKSHRHSDTSLKFIPVNCKFILLSKLGFNDFYVYVCMCVSVCLCGSRDEFEG